jgi:CheY-like chemotaxis protein
MAERQTGGQHSCRRTLKRLADSAYDGAGHWRDLHRAVDWAISYARRVADEEPRDSPAHKVAREIVSRLECYTNKESLTLGEVRMLAQEMEYLRGRAEILPNYLSEGSLWNALHGSIDQHVYVAAAVVEDLNKSLDDATLEIAGLEAKLTGAVRAGLQSARTQFNSKDPSPEILDSLAQTLRNLRESIPDIPTSSTGTLRPLIHARKFLIAVIEDQVRWREAVLRSVDSVRELFGKLVNIEALCFDNVEEALNYLTAKKKPHVRPDDYQEEQDYIIAITDIGLPADPAHAKAVREKTKTPDRNNGYELLRRLRDYRMNIPTVVLTTPSNLYEDQRFTFEHGVEISDYILKKSGVPLDHKLADSISRLISHARSHSIELWRDDHELRVDGIKIPLDEMHFRTFYALCQLSQQSKKARYTTEQIRDQLDTEFRSEYRYVQPPVSLNERALVLAREKEGIWWSGAAPQAIANVLRLWAVSKSVSSGNIFSTLRRLKDQYPSVLPMALDLFDAYRMAHPREALWRAEAGQPAGKMDQQILAQGFEKVFGGLDGEEPEPYKLSNITKHVSRINAEIQKAFRKLGRYIEPRAEVLEGGEKADYYGYRVWGDIVIHEGESEEKEYTLGSRPGDDAHTVLVVENEPIYQNRIKNLLKEAGFSVVDATNIEDAVEVCLSIPRPDILCLDLHIPINQHEYALDVNSGVADGGLRILEAVRRLLPEEDYRNLRVVIPTMFSRYSELLERASHLNVPIINVVPKGISGWEGNLINTVSRLSAEIRFNVVMPAQSLWQRPVIKIMPGTNLGSGRLNLLVNGSTFELRKSLQGRLLSCLLRKPEEVINHHEIDCFVAGQPVTENIRNLWLSKLRSKIRADWLQWPPDSPLKPEHEILETLDNGLVLHAIVEGLAE